jgi:hypothetical protein
MSIWDFLRANLIMLPFIGLGYLVTYWLKSRDVGKKAAWEALNLPVTLPITIIVVAVVLGIAFLVDYASQKWGEATFPAFIVLLTAIVWVMVIIRLWHRRHAGQVLVDTGTPRSSEQTLMIVGFGAVLLMLLFLGLVGIVDLLWVSLVLFIASMLLFHLIGKMTSLQFTEKGISSFESLTKWNQVTSYEWISERNPVLKLRVQQRFLWTSITGAFHWRIPRSLKDDVDSVLAEYAPKAT